MSRCFSQINVLINLDIDSALELKEIDLSGKTGKFIKFQVYTLKNTDFDLFIERKSELFTKILAVAFTRFTFFVIKHLFKKNLQRKPLTFSYSNEPQRIFLFLYD